MLRVSLMTASLFIVSCTPPEIDPLPFAQASESETPDPAKMGPFAVGVRTVVYEDASRPKPDGTPRILTTEIWYPAVQSTRGAPTVSYDIESQFTEEQQASIGVGTIPLLQTAAVRDATPTRAHGTFPLIIFSHGQAAIRWQSTYYTVLLASHGYIVVSTDHEGGTLYDVVRGQLQDTGVGLETRPQDARLLINRMLRIKSDDPLYGLIDADRIGVTGHSFGAITAMRVAAMDSRVKLIVPQAPFDASLILLDLHMPQIPMQIQGANEDQTLPWDDNVVPTMVEVKKTGKPWSLLGITHGGHFTFSDLCAFDLANIADRVQLDIPGANVRKVLEDGCGPTAPLASVAQPLINHFAVAFFNGYFKGSRGSLDLMTQAQADALGGGTGVATFEKSE
jgi:predicted dienelactone hydrolase